MELIERLDAAIETAREKMIASILSWPSSTSALAEDLRDDAIDRYAALVALRARLDEMAGLGCRWEPLFTPALRKPCAEREGQTEPVGQFKDGGGVEVVERAFSFERDACDVCQRVRELDAEAERMLGKEDA